MLKQKFADNFLCFYYVRKNGLKQYRWFSERGSKQHWGTDDSFLIGFLSAVNSLAEIFFRGEELNFLVFGIYEVHLISIACGDYLLIITTNQIPPNCMKILINELKQEFGSYSIECEYVDAKYNQRIEEKFTRVYEKIINEKPENLIKTEYPLINRKESIKIESPSRNEPESPVELEPDFDEVAYLKRKIKRNSSKLRSMKILSKNIEHALNNVFTSIMGKISLLKMDLNSNSKLYNPLKELNDYIEKAASLSFQFSNVLKAVKEHPKGMKESQISFDSEFLSAKTPSHRPLMKGKGKILVMDDERMIRETMVKFLEKMGYSVESVSKGEDAVKLYKNAMKNRKPYDVIFLDLVIREGMGGRDTMEKIKTIDPKVKAILISGMVQDEIVEDYKNFGFSEYVQKPYNFSEISEILRDLIQS